MKLVIGLVGEKGSGKQTFVNFLRETLPNIRQVRFSDILTQTLMIWDIPNTRANLQKLSITMNDSFGSGTLAHAVEFNTTNETADIVILDGVRWKSDAQMVRKFHKNILVYVTADQKLRFERLKTSSEKIGEEGMSWEKFLAEESVQTESFISEIGATADIKIENNGSLEEFKQEILNLYQTSISKMV